MKMMMILNGKIRGRRRKEQQGVFALSLFQMRTWLIGGCWANLIAIIYLWLYSLADPDIHHTFKLYKGSAGLLYANLLAATGPSMNSNNHLGFRV